MENVSRKINSLIIFISKGAIQKNEKSKNLKKKKERKKCISYIKNNRAFESKDQRVVNKLVPQICILDTLVDMFTPFV